MRTLKPLPPSDELKRLFAYDPETGALTWRVQRGKARVGKQAGNLTDDGYLRLGLEGSYYFIHRIIWKMVTGQEPPELIDHEDTNKSNNKWTNLRPATEAENNRNRGMDKRNVSGVKGVTWNSFYRQWQAVVVVDKKHVDFGRFNSIEEAAQAIKGQRELLHGAFARAA